MPFYKRLAVLAVAFLLNQSLFAEDARINVDGGGKLAIIPGEISSGGKASNINWGDWAKRQYTATFEFPVSAREWTEFNFSFKTNADGPVAISLVGPYVAIDSGRKRIDILWDDLSAKNGEIRNGDFEKGPADWYLYAPDQAPKLMPLLEKRGRNNSTSIMTWHDGGAVQYIQAKKDIPVVIHGFCRLANAEQLKDQQTRVTFKANSEWHPAEMNDLMVKPGSALDMESFFPAEPAGTHGRVIINNKSGNFAFADQPETDVIFMGCSFGDVELSKLKSKEDMKNFATQLRRQGYNMARLHFLDHYLMEGSKSDFDFNPERLDLMDYLIACLKERGIYLYFDAMTSWNGFKKGSSWALTGVDLKKDILSSAEIRQHWQTGVTRLLTHMNPYTKTRLVDDPAIAVMLFYNELEFYSLRQGLPPSMLGAWRDWLKQKYNNNPQQLALAWNHPSKFRPEMKFEEVAAFGPAEQWGVGQGYYTDIGLFMIDQEKEMSAWFDRTARQIGYSGLTSLWDMGKQYRNNVARTELPVISMHNYFGHPTQWLTPGSKVSQDSSLANTAQYLRVMATTRFIDRPFFIAEYGHVFWSRYRYEEGLVFGAYSALQGFSGIMVHSSPVCFTPRNPVKPFDIGSDPVSRANQVMTVFLFARRDVKTSPNYIELSLDRKFMIDKGNLNQAANDDSQLALLSRFGVWCNGAKQPEMSKKTNPITVITPSGSAMVTATANTMDVLESAHTGGAGIDRIITELKQRGLIPSANRTAVDKGIFQSDTGELLMNVNSHTFTVITPRFEGLATDKKEAGKLDAITSVQSSIPSSTAVISLDENSLANSRRLLLVYNTDALNTDMELSADHSTLYALGRGPTLIQTGTLRLELKNINAERFTLWALGFDGSRKEKIPFTITGKGQMAISVNTATLKDGPTPFFELVSMP